MTNSVLITGASGLIGRRLTELLLQKGCRVSHVGRTARSANVPSYVWDLEQGTIDKKAFAGVDTIINLASAGIADHRWTASRKQEILNSRLRSTALLHDFLKNNPHTTKSVIGASAIGYYGFGLQNTVLTEESPAGTDFLSTVVVMWEKEIDQLGMLGLRVVKIRTGIVLAAEGGALKELARPVFWGVGAALGTGRQMVSWIHLDDLCELFAMAVKDGEMNGVYNAAAPNPVTNRMMTESIAGTLRRKILLPNIPPIALHILVGEMADLVLFGSNVSCRKIQEAGFQFTYPELKPALDNLLLK